jgi:hypothetical protein
MSNHNEKDYQALISDIESCLAEYIQSGELSAVERSEIVAHVESRDPLDPLLEVSEPSIQVIPEDAAVKEEPSSDIRNLIAKMSLPQKIKAGLFGAAVARGLLIRDSNKVVQAIVLKNPRITPVEIEDFAKNPYLSEFVLRTIGNNPQWMKSYSVKSYLVTNPKTPADLSLRWIKFLNASDVKKIAKSKSVPQVLVTAARKRLEELEKR